MSIKYLNSQARSFVSKNHSNGEFVNTRGQKGLEVLGGNGHERKVPEVISAGQGQVPNLKSHTVSLIN